MKSPQPSSATCLSETQAMLEAISAGFFEAYFEKSQLPCRRFKKLRFEVNPTPAADGQAQIVQLRAEGLGASGEAFPVANLEAVAGRNFRAVRYAVEFSEGELSQLLSQPGCCGLRFMPGVLRNGSSPECPALIAVGVKADGFDIGGGAGYLRSGRTVNFSLAGRRLRLAA